MAPTGIGLSLAFQAPFPALAHPCDARFRAANASERPWRTAKTVPLPKGMKPVGFRPQGHRAMAPTGIGLSLAFQAPFPALAHPYRARFGAANASERP